MKETCRITALVVFDRGDASIGPHAASPLVLIFWISCLVFGICLVMS